MAGPSVFDYNDFRLFLRATVADVVASGAVRSQRTLGSQLRWPSSLISDVLSGRRQLTLSKTLQLSFYLGHDLAETDYLVALVGKDSDCLLTKSYFSKKLADFCALEPK